MSQKVRKYLISLLSMVNVSILIPKKKHVLEALPAIQENKIYTGSDGGALVNAAVPYAIDKAISEGKIKKNSKVLIYAAENTQWQHALIYVKW